MDQLMKRDRAAFQELVYDHFKNVEDEMKRNEARVAELQRVIEAKDARILQLEREFRDARNGTAQPKGVEKTSEERMPQEPNIIDSKAPILKTLAREVTPPLKSPTGIARPNSVNSDVQTDDVPYIHSGAQAEFEVPRQVMANGEQDLLQAHNELRAKYARLEQENTELVERCNQLEHDNSTYQSAFNELKAHHKKEKNKWRQWYEYDMARREASNKRKAQEGQRRSTLSPKPIDAPATPDPTSSPPRPPALSPNRLPEKPAFVIQPPRKGGLFSGLQPSKVVSFPQEPAEPTGNEPSEDNEFASGASVAEAQEQDQLRLPPPRTHTNRTLTSAADDNILSSDATTSDAGSDDPEVTPKAKAPLNPPPALQQKNTGSKEKPVVIKSEPKSSQDDLGYNIFEQESLDLDDVGHPIGVAQEDKLRKRRKLNTVEQENSRIAAEAEKAAPQFHDDLEMPDDGLPVFQGVKLYKNMSIDAPLPPRPKVQEAVTPVRNNPEPKPRALQASPPARRGPITTSTPPSKSSKRRSHRDTLIHVLEDGTDGERPANLNHEIPDIQTTTRLDDLLNNPPPPNPILQAMDRSAVNRRSRGTNTKFQFGEGSDIFKTPTNPSSSGKRQANTDPIPSKRSADVAITCQGKKKPAHPATVDPITRFAINPAANNGLDFAYHEVVRDKEQRKCLPGCTRACCKDMGKFVEAAGLPLNQKRGPRWRSSSPAGEEEDEVGAVDGRREFVERFGRHREAFPRRRTPPLFWESDMLDTQTLKRQHEEADKIEREKLELRRREAKKGSKGRFVRKW